MWFALKPVYYWTSIVNILFTVVISVLALIVKSLGYRGNHVKYGSCYSS